MLEHCSFPIMLFLMLFSPIMLQVMLAEWGQAYSSGGMAITTVGRAKVRRFVRAAARVKTPRTFLFLDFRL